LTGLLPQLGPTLAVDHQLRMASIARGRLGSRVPVVVAEANGLPFRDERIDAVVERHAQPFFGEVRRILAPAGVFVLQQVGGRNLQSLFDAFGWGSNAAMWAGDDPPLRTVSDLAREATDCGLEVVRTDEYEVSYVLLDLESLIFTLKAVPLPEQFDPERHLDGVNHLLSGGTARGIESTEHRELLIARKMRA
jgi:SAM-dependent methyltransferase